MNFIGYAPHIFISPSTEENLVVSMLATLNHAVMNVRLQKTLRSYCISLDICPEMGLLHLMTAWFLIFKGTSTVFLMRAMPVYIATNNTQGSPFLLILDTPSYLLIFLMTTIFIEVR